MNLKSNTRNIGIDLLRICSMIMVVILHILNQGGILSVATPHTLNYNVAWFMEISAYCAVNCYALISGYVGINSKHHPSGLANTWLQVAFYSVVITVVMHFTFVPSNLKTLIKSFFPVTFESYWYFTSYFAIWFFIPFMNSAIDNLPKTKAGGYLIAAGLILLPISILRDRFFLNNGYSAVWLGYLYLIGAYISKHKLFVSVSAIKSILIYLACISVTFVCKIFLPMLEAQNISLTSYISPLLVIAAISLLVLFNNLKIPDSLNKLIVSISSCAFGVYLIHTHPAVFYNIWGNKFSFLADKSPFMLIIGVLGCAIGIFVGCAFIDCLRLLLFKALKIKQLWTFVFDFIQKQIEKAVNKNSLKNNI